MLSGSDTVNGCPEVMRCEPRLKDVAERGELPDPVIAPWGIVGCAGIEATGGIGTGTGAEVVAGGGAEVVAGSGDELVSGEGGGLLSFTDPLLPPFGVTSVD